jgi:hypothetical protein
MEVSDFNMVEFLDTRKRVFHLIDQEIRLDGHHKSYEGQFNIVFNNRFKYDEDKPEICFELSCYVAPVGGRGHCFESVTEINYFCDDWQKDLNERASLEE